MEDSGLFPIALLYAQGASGVEGATRFQKLVFLAQEETDLGSRYTFHAEKYGPYSYDLASTLEMTIDRDVVTRNVIENEVGNEKHAYGLTEKGVRMAKEMVSREEYERMFDVAARTKRRFDGWQLDRLLRYVYRNYPEYATETDLDTERLFDPESRSQFLEPDREADFAGQGPEEALKMNYSAEDAFSRD